MKPLLPKLSARLAEWRDIALKKEVPRYKAVLPNDASEVITHDYLWPRIGIFLRSGDVVVSETGTSSFGVLDVPFPDDATLVTQILWGSIGWTVGKYR